MKVLLMHGGYGEGVAGGQSMAELLERALLCRGEEVALAIGNKAGGSLPPLPWAPDVIHALDLSRHEFAWVGRDLASRSAAIFALTPASAPEVWDDPAAGAELCRAADVLYALTAAEAECLVAAGADPSRIVVVGQGPRLEGRPDPAGFMDRYGLAAPMVLFLGRKMRSKGYRELLEAAPAVWRTMPETSFAFAGPAVALDWERDFTEHADPRLVDLGMLNEQEKHSALMASDLLCLPTTVDVFPLVLAEAWHCGKPVVCGRFDGVNGVVRDGVDGIVVEPRADAVAAALLRLLSDEPLRTAMGRDGRDRALREMTWEAVAARVVEGYRWATRKLGTGA
jgi:glycosyltransferase involved in cell wall biosynthesis